MRNIFFVFDNCRYFQCVTTITFIRCVTTRMFGMLCFSEIVKSFNRKDFI